MKKNYPLIILTIALTTLLFSNSGCKRDKAVIPNDLIIGNPYITCNINGTVKRNDTPRVFIDTINNILKTNLLLSGSDGISLFINQPAVGTFNYGPTLVATYINSEGLFRAQTGTFTISILSKKVIKGSFEFEAVNLADAKKTIKISDGKFEWRLEADTAKKKAATVAFNQRLRLN